MDADGRRWEAAAPPTQVENLRYREGRRPGQDASSCPAKEMVVEVVGDCSVPQELQGVASGGSDRPQEWQVVRPSVGGWLVVTLSPS